MKNLKPLFFLMLIGFLNSCSDLEEEPFSFLSPAQFYSTSDDAEAALTAAYGSLANSGIYGRSLWMLSDYSADQMFPKPVVGRELLTIFAYDATFDQIGAFWNESYQGINNANQVIAYVPDIIMNTTRKDQIIAEAKFLRALYYFNLVRNFGDVPLKLTPTQDLSEANSPKSSEQEIYDQIVTDLTEAEVVLTNGIASVKGRVTKGAASGLLAKVYLYKEDWNNASLKAEEVITSGVYELTESVVDLWNVDLEDENYNENIFAVEFSRNANLETQDYTSFFGPTGSAPIFSAAAWGSSFAYDSFYESYNDDDDRKGLMQTSFTNASGQVFNQENDPNLLDRVIINKFADPKAIGGRNENNFPILRYADVLLIYAEASAQASGGPTIASYNAINEVRNRASLENLTPGLGLQAFVDAVLQERSWELAFEADRWYDLTRTNTFLEVSNVTNSWFPNRPVQSRHEKFPIPENEVISNPNLEQNPPW